MGLKRRLVRAWRRAVAYVTLPWRIAVGLWRILDLDIRDAHFYGGLLLVAVGLGYGWTLEAGMVAFGAGLIYAAIRVPQRTGGDHGRR